LLGPAPGEKHNGPWPDFVRGTCKAWRNTHSARRDVHGAVSIMEIGRFASQQD
jgi:hypothetical protein